MTEIATLDIASWHPTISTERTGELARTLEGGGILVLPNLAFVIGRDEERFLDPKWSDARAKNISFEEGRVKGAIGASKDLAQLALMIERFARCASDLIAALFSRYEAHLKRARTSFRRKRPASCWRRLITNWCTS